MKDPVAEAVDILTRAGVPFELESASIRVPPEAPDGFEVWMGPGGQVAYEGWHTAFDDPEQALACFLMGLTDGVRLRVTLRGGRACKWSVETRDGLLLGSVGLLFFPFWRRRALVTKANRRPIATLRESPPSSGPRSPA